MNPCAWFYQLHVSLNGFITLLNPAVSNVAVIGLSPYGVTCATNLFALIISFIKPIGLLLKVLMMSVEMLYDEVPALLLPILVNTLASRPK